MLKIEHFPNDLTPDNQDKHTITNSWTWKQRQNLPSSEDKLCPYIWAYSPMPLYMSLFPNAPIYEPIPQCAYIWAYSAMRLYMSLFPNAKSSLCYSKYPMGLLIFYVWYLFLPKENIVVLNCPLYWFSAFLLLTYHVILQSALIKIRFHVYLQVI